MTTMIEQKKNKISVFDFEGEDKRSSSYKKDEEINYFFMNKRKEITRENCKRGIYWNCDESEDFSLFKSQIKLDIEIICE